jgi:hypothetical protein
MKKFFLVAACLVFALTFAAPANSATLGLEYLVGTVAPASPSDPSDEFVYTTNLIDFWNGGADPSDFDPGPPATGYLYDVTIAGAGASVTGPLPAAEGTGVQYASLSGGVDLTGYTYVFAKFGNDGALYFLDGSVTSLTGFDPAWGPFSEQGGGLSHVTLFGPGTTRLPEAGALIMFGSGLIGLVGYRRIRRMQ